MSNTVKVAYGWDVFPAFARGFNPGGIFWFGDEYTFYSDYSDNIEALVTNVMTNFLGSAGPWRIAAGSGMTFIKTAMNLLGHTATTPGNWNDLSTSNYDFAIPPLQVSQTVLWNFVLAGGGLMIPLGTYDETTSWSTLFGYTGIVHIPSYVFAGLVTPNGGGSDYWTGVSSVYMNGSSQLSLTTPTAGGTNMSWTGTLGSTYTVFAAWKA